MTNKSSLWPSFQFSWADEVTNQKYDLKIPLFMHFSILQIVLSVLDFPGNGMIPTTVNKILDTNHGWEPKYLQFPTNRVSLTKLIQLTHQTPSIPTWPQEGELDNKTRYMYWQDLFIDCIIHTKFVAQLKKGKYCVLIIDPRYTVGHLVELSGGWVKISCRQSHF